jgi:hypothetical protein
VASALDAKVRVIFEPAEEVIKQYDLAEKKEEVGSVVVDVVATQQTGNRVDGIVVRPSRRNSALVKSDSFYVA